MPEFPIPSARILLVSQIQGGRLPPAPLSGTPMLETTNITLRRTNVLAKVTSATDPAPIEAPRLSKYFVLLAV